MHPLDPLEIRSRKRHAHHTRNAVVHTHEFVLSPSCMNLSKGAPPRKKLLMPTHVPHGLETCGTSENHYLCNVQSYPQCEFTKRIFDVHLHSAYKAIYM